MEEIRKAMEEDNESIVKLVRETMSEVYPNYYPTGAVELFLSYQTKDNIIRDIQNGIVYVLENDGLMIGTGTIKENRVCRLVVKTNQQEKGYGTKIIEYLEEQILSNYETVILDASLPACELYRKRGYKTMEYKKLQAENGDYICYPLMQLK